MYILLISVVAFRQCRHQRRRYRHIYTEPGTAELSFHGPIFQPINHNCNQEFYIVFLLE